MGFAVLLTVEPDSRGFGTHQRFGLPPCTFKMMFGIPCPSCGGTTSVAHFRARRMAAGPSTNSAAFCLAVAATLFVPWSWLSCWCGRTVGVSAPADTLLWGMIFLSVVALAQWVVRLLIS